jgi:hypothetical protein
MEVAGALWQIPSAAAMSSMSCILTTVMFGTLRPVQLDQPAAGVGHPRELVAKASQASLPYGQ